MVHYECKNSEYFSIVVDEMKCVTKQEQISFGLCSFYNWTIKESFLHSESAGRLAAVQLEKTVHLLKHHGLQNKTVNLVIKCHWQLAQSWNSLNKSKHHYLQCKFISSTLNVTSHWVWKHSRCAPVKDFNSAHYCRLTCSSWTKLPNIFIQHFILFFIQHKLCIARLLPYVSQNRNT